MKTVASIFLFAALIASTTLKASDKIEVVKSNKDNSSLLLKMDKALLGGTINIVYSNGDLVTEEVLKRKKLILDLSKVRQGEYTVTIIKDGKKENFHFTKDDQNQVYYRG